MSSSGVGRRQRQLSVQRRGGLLTHVAEVARELGGCKKGGERVNAWKCLRAGCYSNLLHKWTRLTAAVVEVELAQLLNRGSHGISAG